MQFRFHRQADLIDIFEERGTLNRQLKYKEANEKFNGKIRELI